MPIYEYECPTHGKFELYMNLSDADREWVWCTTTHCAAACERVWSLVAMQPDTMWSGVTTQHGYFTSKKRNQQFLKENSLQRVERGLVEDVKKKSKRRVPERLEKNEKNLDKFLQKELAGL